MEAPDERLAQGMIGTLVYKKEAAKFLGVSQKTINRYVKAGKLKSFQNTVNGRRYFDSNDLLCLIGARIPKDRLVVLYCRAAPLPGRAGKNESAQARLSRQVESTTEYCKRAGINVDLVITDVGIGSTMKGRDGVETLFELVLRKKVAMIVTDTADRIGRWGAEDMLATFFKWHGVEWHVINRVWLSEEYREEAKDDLALVLNDAKLMMSGKQPISMGLRSPAQDKD